MTLSGRFPGLLLCPSATYWWPPVPNQRADPEKPNSRLTDKGGKVEKASECYSREGGGGTATKRIVGAEGAADPVWPRLGDNWDISSEAQE